MNRFSPLLFAALAAAFLALPARAGVAPTILVDGTIVQTDVPPLVVDGHVLVPLRGIFERFGADVGYDPAADVAFATRGDLTVQVAVDSVDARIDGRHVAMDAPAREFGGRVEVPLRFVAEALGISVDYDAGTDTVVLVSGFRPGNFVAAGPGSPGLSYASTKPAAAIGSTPPAVDEERPAPDALIGTQYPQIYARLSGGASSVDPATVRVLIDGADVTDSSTVSSAYVSYTPPTAMQGGAHSVEVSGQSDDGAPFDERWTFRIEDDMSTSSVASMIGYSAPAFGYSRFGFFPPGFSVFAPGPQFFVEDEPIVIVFFSPFFPIGSGFFTLSGFPGQFAMTPWLGCPGFFWSTLSVPAGIFDPDAIVGAHFTTSDGRSVIVRSTAPLHIDGTRRALPATIRFAVRARLVDRPATPRSLVAFRRTVPFARVMPIAHVGPVLRSVPVRWRAPLASRAPTSPRRPTAPAQRASVPMFPARVTAPMPAAAPIPVMIPVRRAAPVVIPRKPPA